jgi:hypothetical protein
MITARNRVFSRTLGLLALLAALLVGWLGWWALALAAALALGSALLAPKRIYRGHHPWHELANRINRKLQPHSWRPTSRVRGWRR